MYTPSLSRKKWFDDARKLRVWLAFALNKQTRHAPAHLCCSIFFFFFAVTVTWAPLTVSVFHDNVLNYDRQNSSAVFWPKYKLHNQWPFCHLLIMQYLMLNTMSHWSFWIGANDSFKSQESDYETHKRLHVLATYSHCRLCVHTPSNVLTYNVQSRAKVCGPKVPRFFFFLLRSLGIPAEIKSARLRACVSPLQRIKPIRGCRAALEYIEIFCWCRGLQTIARDCT